MQVTPQRREAFADLVFAGLVIGAAMILFIGAADLPPPRFEPMGSAAVPKILGTIMVLLALAIGGRAILKLRVLPTDAQIVQMVPFWRGGAVIVSLVLYVAALDFGRVPFVLATTIFITAAGMIMGKISPKSAGLFAVLGICVSTLIYFVFTHFLFIQIG